CLEAAFPPGHKSLEGIRDAEPIFLISFGPPADRFLDPSANVVCRLVRYLRQRNKKLSRKGAMIPYQNEWILISQARCDRDRRNPGSSRINNELYLLGGSTGCYP